MICPDCRAAGAILSETEIIHQYLDGRPQEMRSGAEVAEEFHDNCKGGTWCDCQHVITTVVKNGNQ